MTKIKTKCWICGNNANSGEHRIKKSDLELLYPNVSQQLPIYHRCDGVQQRPIGSTNSKYFKYDNFMCSCCNNALTQDSDKAWEKLSNHLHKNWDEVLRDGKIDLSSLFSDIELNLKLVQLYFVKLFGCKIVESGADICLVSFSESLLNNAEHPSLYFSIRDSHISSSGNYSSLSDIEISYDDHRSIIYAHMFYTIGQITIDLIYCPNEKYADFIDFNGAEKPSQITQGILKLSKISYSLVLPKYVQSLMKD